MFCRLSIAGVCAAISSGALYAGGFCGYELPLCSWICWAPLLFYLQKSEASLRSTWLLSWLAGLTAHLIVYTWIMGLLTDFAYLPLPLALLGYVLLCAAQSGLFALWGVLFYFIHRRAGMHMAWAAPLCMVVAEWVFPALFPSYLANAQYKTLWLIQSLDIWGPLGITALVLGCSSVLAHVLYQRHAFKRWAWKSVAVWSAVFAANALYGYLRVPQVLTHNNTQKSVRLGLIQTNMGIYAKHEDPAEGLRRHREQSLDAQKMGADLILWPESGYNFALYTGTLNVKEKVHGPLLHTPLLFGGLRVTPLEHPGYEMYNTAFLTDGKGDVLGTYDKTYLLAFGEYLPLGDIFPFLYKLSPHSSHFTRGTHTQPLTLNNIRYGVLICYEDIIPRFVRKLMKEKPDVLINITNDAWFGASKEPLIHLALATFRAVESRKYLVRATNSGLSAVVDPTGNILAQSQLLTRSNLMADVRPMSMKPTLYTLWGDWLGWVCVIWVFLKTTYAYCVKR